MPTVPFPTNPSIGTRHQATDGGVLREWTGNVWKLVAANRIDLRGGVPAASELPTDGQLGHAWVARNTGHMWVFTDSDDPGSINGFDDTGAVPGAAPLLYEIAGHQVAVLPPSMTVAARFTSIAQFEANVIPVSVGHEVFLAVGHGIRSLETRWNGSALVWKDVTY